jgi:hypothetical protein
MILRPGGHFLETAIDGDQKRVAVEPAPRREHQLLANEFGFREAAEIGGLHPELRFAGGLETRCQDGEALMLG